MSMIFPDVEELVNWLEEKVCKRMYRATKRATSYIFVNGRTKVREERQR